MSRIGSLGHRLYTGEVSYDFVGRARRWYAISAVILLLSIGAVVVRGLDLGIEFRGGAQFQVQSAQADVDRARTAVGRAGVADQIEVVKLGDDRLNIETPDLPEAGKARVQQELSKEFGVPARDISAQIIGPSWGEDISSKALRGLIFFLIGVVIFMSFYFQWRMALAGIIALIHDLIITVGIYALVGFTVTPATVIGLLTILGYSLYDTVVVYDKVKENTASLQASARMTYSQAANLAVNQTLVRSINTSIIALLPVGAILFVGAGLLGAGTLKDLALALFVGIAAGTYSSIFIATPIAAALAERDPAMKALARRVEARRSGAAAGASARSARRSGGATALLDRDANDADTGVVDDGPVVSPDGADGDLERPVESRPQPARARSGATAQPRTQQRRPQAKRRPSGKKRR